MRLDGRHRVFVVLAGLWVTLGPWIFPAWRRPTIIRSWIGYELWDLFPRGDFAQTLLFLALPIVSLYGVGWAGRKVMAWVADGFDQRANSGFSEPGRHQ